MNGERLGRKGWGRGGSVDEEERRFRWKYLSIGFMKACRYIY
jgi:hypothetical protein